jgi:hypothetical protein
MIFLGIFIKEIVNKPDTTLKDTTKTVYDSISIDLDDISNKYNQIDSLLNKLK